MNAIHPKRAPSPAVESPGSDAGFAEPLLTVAICTRNRAVLVERALRSVLPQIKDDTRVLVVDNASTDGTSAAVARWAAASDCVSCCHEGEVGLSAARNTALRRARGRFVLFLDDDAVAEPGWLAAYQRFLSAPASQPVAVVGGAVVPEYEVSPPSWYARHANRLDLGEVCRPVAASGGPWGGNIAYRRDPALRVGGFDVELGRRGNFLGLHEESDLNRRLVEAGYQIWWLPGAPVRHLIPAERLRLRWALRGEFCGGRSSATRRLRGMSRARDRVLWTLGRLLIAPLHLAANLLLAVFTLAALRRSAAARALKRAARIAGFAWELGCQGRIAAPAVAPPWSAPQASPE